jgi:hypothetical protein
MCYTHPHTQMHTHMYMHSQSYGEKFFNIRKILPFVTTWMNQSETGSDRSQSTWFPR